MTEIKVQDEPCTDGWINVFRSMWNGTDTGCYIADPTQILTQASFNNLYDGEICYKIAPNATVIQNNTLGKYICGYLDGKSFLNVTRPNPTTLTCPEGTSPCSIHTSANTTICYPAEEHSTKCPINLMQFYADGET